MTAVDIFLLVVLGVFLTLQGVGLFLFASNLYAATNVLREVNLSLTELACQVKGLPHNLNGITPAIRALAKALPDHTLQVGALVDVVKGAAKEAPPEFDVNGKDTNWTAEIPQDPFGEEESRG